MRSVSDGIHHHSVRLSALPPTEDEPESDEPESDEPDVAPTRSRGNRRRRASASPEAEAEPDAGASVAADETAEAIPAEVVEDASDASDIDEPGDA